MNKFSEYLLGYKEDGMNYLRANVPELQRLESLVDLTNLKLVNEPNDFKVTDLGLLMLRYQATAPTLFPHVRKNIISSGIAKKNNMLYRSIKCKGKSDESYSLKMGFYGNRLQIYLTVTK